MLPPFRLARPTSLDEALTLVSEDNVPYCGGTELLLAMRAGLLRPAALVDLKRVPELSGIAVQDDVLVIGAATTHADVAEHPAVRRVDPALADVAHRVGNARVRSQGTIGGNLCFAEPRSDLVALLACFAASVTLAGGSGRRELPVQDFVQGAYWTAREPDELMVDVRVPLRPRRAVYLKFQVSERPTVGVAVSEEPTSGACRLVVGAVGEIPLVVDVSGVEDLDPESIADSVEPTPDLSGSAEYKRHLTAAYIRRALRRLKEEAR